MAKLPTAVKSWKFLVEKDGKIVSDHDATRSADRRTVWEVGQWKHQNGVIRPCVNGFHHSNNPYDALTYVSGSVLARVEVKGTRASDDDDEWSFNHKEAVSDMRIVKAGVWGKNDCVALSLHIAHFAASWLNDKSRLAYKRPTADERQLIDAGLGAVRSYLRDGTKIPASVMSDLSSGSWCARYTDTSNVIDCVYHAGSAAGADGSPSYASHASHMATYAAGTAIMAVDRGNHENSTVKASVNDWMENRFKTLPRL